VGGAFDDAGFPTRRRILADGSREVGALEGEGQFWRSSYRDPPCPGTTTLLVETAGATPVDQGILVRDLRLHPVSDDRWILEVDGSLLRRGEPSGAVLGLVLEVDPADLVLRCAAAVGPARRTARGVVTPTLVFEGLGLRA
jgi:hypothetical protein